ncbi:MAG: hypothetical protein L0G99_02570 [Propionibacteriales bacterium]|nr:hypothetical protein [Propionibacteriales bacterium]
MDDHLSVRPLSVDDLPVVARALSTNPASTRVLEKVGLAEVWRGRSDHGGPTSGMKRVVHADRALTPGLLAALVALG